ncbi:MAG: hypothetical protein JWN15_3794, partial [Firmicutes bacterium]|nr:hypothetical protein [Bacillota bacterium]
MKMVIGEWQKILAKKALVLILIAMTFVPLLYSSIFLASFWDPYGKTDRIPVAVVNNDTGAVMGGKQLQIGQKFVDDLKNNPSFKWSFVADKQQALKELDQGNYFLVIELPANFSQNATTLMDQQPQKMQLNYYTNPGRNYPVSQITASAMTKINGQIADAVRKQYAQTVFDSLKTMADGMGQASSGSGKLDQGAKARATGSQTLN